MLSVRSGIYEEKALIFMRYFHLCGLDYGSGQNGKCLAVWLKGVGGK